jgi:hypothetical protein
MNTNIIQLTNNIFSITRSEGWGYVENICEFDKEIFELIDKNYVPSQLEGGNCQVTYNFRIKQTDKPNSNIVFIKDFGDKKYISEKYIYDNSKKIIYLLRT